MIKFYEAAWQGKLRMAQKAGDFAEANRIERLLDMVRQLRGARAESAACNPPAFFVRGVVLGQAGEIESCEAFYLPELQGENVVPVGGKLNLPSGGEGQVLRHRCPHCGTAAPVVGEYYYDMPPETGPVWLLVLYTLCGGCVRLEMIGEREEPHSFDELLK